MNGPIDFPSDDCPQALAAGWLPIRELSRQTGVNPVTLRAWERRYGLLRPQRTAKGHRLYDAGHVERVRAILTWINRGVAVSQVASLLATRTPQAEPRDSLWQAQCQRLLQAIAQLNERQLDDAFNANLTLYPPATLCTQLLLPLLAELEQRWQGQFGSSLERVFFHGWLRSKLGGRLYQSNRLLSGAPLLLVGLSDLPMEPGLWLSAWLAASADCPVEVYDWPVPLDELGLLVDRRAPRALLLYASQSLDSSLLRRDLPRLAASLPLPLLLAGPASSIHHDELQAIDGLQLALNPLEALQQLQHLGLLGAPQ